MPSGNRSKKKGHGGQDSTLSTKSARNRSEDKEKDKENASPSPNTTASSSETITPTTSPSSADNNAARDLDNARARLDRLCSSTISHCDDAQLTDLAAKLHSAIECENIVQVLDLLAKLPNDNIVLPSGHAKRSPLHTAIMRKCNEAIVAIVSHPCARKSWIDQCDTQGNVPAALCTRSSKYYDKVALRTLLDAGGKLFSSELNSDKKHTMPPLDIFAWVVQHVTDDSGLVDRIVLEARQAGVLDLVTNQGYGPLHLAASMGTSDHVRSLLDVGAMDPGNTRDRKWPAIHIAACSNALSIVELLIDAGCPINLAAHDGRTPLHTAVQAGHVPMVKFLLSRGADPIAKDAMGWLPITWALDSTTSLTAFESMWVLLHSGDEGVEVVKQWRTQPGGESLVDFALVQGKAELAMYLLIRGIRSVRLAAVGNIDLLTEALNLLADRLVGNEVPSRQLSMIDMSTPSKPPIAISETEGSDRTPLVAIDLSPIVRPEHLNHATSEDVSMLRLSSIHMSSTAMAGKQDDASTNHKDSTQTGVVDLSPSSQGINSSMPMASKDLGLPPVPGIRPIQLTGTSAAVRSSNTWYPVPAIRVAMPEDAARVLVAALDSHLGDVAGLALEAGPLDPDMYLAGDYRGLAESNEAQITGMVDNLSQSGVTSGLDAVSPALNRALRLVQTHPAVDLESAFHIASTTIGKHIPGMLSAAQVIREMQSADTTVRDTAADAARDLAEFTRLQDAKEYLGALRAEDRWIAKQLELLARRGELVRRVERAGNRQRALVEGLSQLLQWADAEYSKLAGVVDERMRAVASHVGQLAGVRERVRLAVSAIEVEWQAKVAGAELSTRVESDKEDDDVNTSNPSTMAPWLLEFCGLFLHMERMLARENFASTIDITPVKATSMTDSLSMSDDVSSTPRVVVSRMLQWYSESKAGDAARLHEAMSLCLQGLNAHAESLTLIRHSNEWALSAALAHSRQGLNTLSGHAGHLRAAIPEAYEQLHTRLVFNERLCKRNLLDMQSGLQRVLQAKNRAFEQRRVADLARCEDEAAHLHAALEKEEKRLVAIEGLMQRAFAGAHRYLRADRVEELQQEYLELGVLLKFSTTAIMTTPELACKGKRSRYSTSSTSISSVDPSVSNSPTARPTAIVAIDEWDSTTEDEEDEGTQHYRISPTRKARRLLGTSTPREAVAMHKNRVLGDSSLSISSESPNLIRRMMDWSVRLTSPLFGWLPGFMNREVSNTNSSNINNGEDMEELDTARIRLRALVSASQQTNALNQRTISLSDMDVVGYEDEEEESMGPSTAEHESIMSMIV